MKIFILLIVITIRCNFSISLSFCTLHFIQVNLSLVYWEKDLLIIRRIEFKVVFQGRFQFVRFVGIFHFQVDLSAISMVELLELEIWRLWWYFYNMSWLREGLLLVGAWICILPLKLAFFSHAPFLQYLPFKFDWIKVLTASHSHRYRPDI